MKKTIKVNVTRSGMWLDGDVTYGQVGHWFNHVSRDLKMDVMYPSEPQEKPYPCIVWICGGGWQQMDYHAHLPNLVDLVREGYVVASVAYRDSNYATFPGPLEDVKKAIRYLKAHKDRYAIDEDKFGVMGESAGGHLAGFVGVTGDNKEFDTGEYLDYSSAVQACCPWYMPSYFKSMLRVEEGNTALLPESRLIGADAATADALVAKASPLTYVTESAPPFLLLHGTNDTLVPHNQSELMYDALEEKGVPVDLISIIDANHADQHFYQEAIMHLIVDFFGQHLK